MAKPIVAIVGRPNVGKSTLFNRIAEKRVSIVDDTPGVTRDRIYADAEWTGHEFALIDTGGIDFDEKDTLLPAVRNQAKLAMEEADVILFVVDGKAGITDVDQQIVMMLRTAKKPVVLAVNKVDNLKGVTDSYEFYGLGLGDPIAVSAVNALNLGDLLDAIVEGAVLRVRPKAMTVAVILAGLFPIMWGTGTGSEVMQRIAAPMVGGMITAPLLSMFVVPAAYLLMRRRRQNG